MVIRKCGAASSHEQPPTSVLRLGEVFASHHAARLEQLWSVEFGYAWTTPSQFSTPAFTMYVGIGGYQFMFLSDAQLMGGHGHQDWTTHVDLLIGVFVLHVTCQDNGLFGFYCPACTTPPRALCRLRIPYCAFPRRLCACCYRFRLSAHGVQMLRVRRRSNSSRLRFAPF